MASTRRRVALASQAGLPAWEVDDRPFHAALRARGVEPCQPAWDDPAFRWEECAAVLVRTTWDYVPKATAFAAWADAVARRTRLFNPPEIVRWNLDKRYLRDLEARGAPVLPTTWIEPGAAGAVGDAVRELGVARAFLKPSIGASSSGTLRFATDASGVAAATAHVAAAPDVAFLLQPYLDRVEREGETSLVYFEGRFSHAVRKTPVPGDYRVQDDWGATDAPHAPAADEFAAAEATLGAALFAEPALYARVDLLRDASGRPRLVELEMIEPSLFFRHAPEAADVFAEAFLRRAGI
ncbi:MAG TPA: hypothetical protein VEI02_12985 [Planctomycetota bacterium]|nr:hypothetical protein [Planctomycetota bacterium]